MNTVDPDSPVKQMRALVREADPAWAQAVRLAWRATSGPEAEAMGRAVLRAGGRGRLAEHGLLETSVAVLSSSTVNELPGQVALAALRRRLVATVHLGEFDDWRRAVLTEGPLHDFAPRVTVLVLDDRAVLGDVAAGLPIDEIIARCAAFPEELADWCRAFRASPGGVLVLTTVPLRPAHRGRLISYTDRARLEGAWLSMNARIAELGQTAAPTVVLSHERTSQTAGGTFAPDRLRLVASAAYSAEYLWALAGEVAQIAAADLGRSAKGLVLDLDDTLWSGTIGEAGAAGVSVSGYPGSAHRELQAHARALADQGVLLAAASKNDEDLATSGLDEHPDMILRADAFAVTRINWQPKPANVAQIANELNIGADAMVFVDDNPVERAEMEHGLPQVRTVDLPRDPAGFVAALLVRDDFCVLHVTDEDRRRSSMYRARADRAALERTAGSHEDFLSELGTEVSLVEDDPFSRPRLVQLFAKTNQFNLSGRRYRQDDLESASRSGRWFFGLRASDRFGDHGTIAALSVQLTDRTWAVENMVLSCRVFGRNIEDAALIHVLQRARAAGATSVVATYLPTDRNHRCAAALDRLGFAGASPGDSSTRVHDLTAIPVLPDWVHLTEKEPIG